MIVIVGTGALATLIAARLARLTAITMLGSWTEAIAAINQNGIEVEGEPGRVQVTATTDPAECVGATYAIVLVKAWQTARAAQQIKSFLAPKGLALTLQNGLGNFETLVAELGEARVALGTTTQGANLLGPGQVRDAGQGLTQVAYHANLSPLIQSLQTAGIKIQPEPPSKLQSLIWGKLTVNCAINPLTALLHVPNGELLHRPEALALLNAAASEVANIAEAKEIHLPFEDAAAQARKVAQATALNRSSMFQDILRGTQTEIDAINGAVVQAGQELGIATPVNRTLWQLVKALSEP
jgi:2-dehydropantoate 2-reductase